MLFLKDLTLLVKIAEYGVYAIYSYVIFIFYVFFSNLDKMHFKSEKMFSFSIGELAGTASLAY
jgi:sodium-coupled neutral amino acid transporter 9